jgi:hypothetical protein
MDDLVDALARGKKPTSAEIRSELVSVETLAQEMEDGQALPEKESAIATLEAENENLKVGLETANTELETFRAERRRQEEDKKRQEMPEIQFKILQRLPTEEVDGYWLRTSLENLDYGEGDPETNRRLVAATDGIECLVERGLLRN